MVKLLLSSRRFNINVQDKVSFKIAVCIPFELGILYMYSGVNIMYIQIPSKENTL